MLFAFKRLRELSALGYGIENRELSTEMKSFLYRSQSAGTEDSYVSIATRLSWIEAAGRWAFGAKVILIAFMHNSEAMRSLGSRIAGTIIAGVCWLAFVVLFLAFYPTNFTFWQNMAVFIASIVIACGIVAAIWIKWALD